MKMNEINTLDLNLFLALEHLLQHRSVTRAAEHMGITQSAMSHRLKNLRAVFDDPLLVRGEEGYLLTPTAQRLLPYISRGLTELRLALENRNQFNPATETRTFRLLTYDYVDLLVLPHLLQQFRKDAPNIHLKIRPLPQEGWERTLEQGRADLAVGTFFPDRASFMKRKLFEDNFLSGLGPNHPHQEDTLDLDTFLNGAHALISTTGKGPGAVDSALLKINKTRNVVVQLANFATAPLLLMKSDLILTAPKLMLHHLAENLPLRLFKPPIALNDWPLNMVWHQRFNADAAHQWLREQVLLAANKALQQNMR